VALGNTDNVHGHSFAYVGEQSDDQLPSTFLEPPDNISQMVLQTNVGVPTKAVIHTHYTQENPSVLMSSTTARVNHTIANVCKIPIVWALCFILGGTPKETLDKVELLVAASPTKHRPSFEMIQHWARYSCLAWSQDLPGFCQPRAA
jgi:hypothetical protein